MALYVDYASVDGNWAPDVDAAHKWGVAGAIIRGSYSYGGLLRADPCLPRDLPAWRTLGPPGAYVILDFHRDPVAQAQKFIETYERKPGDLPPALDLEADSAAALKLLPNDCLERAERAYDELVKHYGDVMVYTSARVWEDVVGDLPSKMGAAPLWLKVPYPYKAGQPPHAECRDAPGAVPKPWTAPGSAGVWLRQFQGDAKGVPGFTSTVDLSAFVNYEANDDIDPRYSWVGGRLAARGATSVVGYQAGNGLTADGVVGPRTFVALTSP